MIEVRAAEAKALKQNGYEPILTKTRWLLLKRPENLTEKQETRLAELLQYNLKSIRAYLLKEDFNSSGATVTLLGRPIPGFVVHQDHAFEDRADETGRPNAAPTGRFCSTGSGPKGSFPAAWSRVSTPKQN